MKCPHCHNEVKEDARYCPHCGYHLQEKQASIPIYRYVIGAIAIVVFIFYTLTMTMLNQYFIKPQISHTIGTLSKEGTFLKSYDSLQSFNKAFDNANQFISPIQDYTKSLSKYYHLSFQTSYHFRYYSNDNLKVTITNKAHIAKNVSLTIVREYDRTKTYDEETYTLTKNNCHQFEDLKMKELSPYILKMTSKKTYTKLVEAFKKKHSLFNQKKSLGHYGVGVYQEEGSLVYYPDGQSYRSEFEVYKNKNYQLVR